jgi:glutamate 5-kinase
MSRPQRLVLKFGSGILSTPRGNSLDARQFARLTREVADLVRQGHQCVIVSSGAVAAGLAPMGLSARPSDLSAKQACAAVGQSKLMHFYALRFARHGLDVAQLLLTHSDLDSRQRFRNARNTLEHLLATGRVVPVINENDSVAVEELKFGDNDHLSADVAAMIEADRLIILTDADGRLVSRVTDIAAAAGLVRNETGRLSVGGMQTKLQAAARACEAGITTHIANGRKPGQLAAIMRGGKAGTVFVAARKGA